MNENSITTAGNLDMSTKLNKCVPFLESILNLPYIKDHIWRSAGFVSFVVVKEDFSAAYNHILK